MRFTFLGTADSTGYPHAFCACAYCQEARQLGGPSIRLRASALINDDLLIDLGPDLAIASVRHNRPLHQVRWCLQTHPHIDHLDPAHLFMRSPDYGLSDLPPFTFYGTEESIRRIYQVFNENKATRNADPNELLSELQTSLVTIAAGDLVQAGPYEIQVLPASHANPGEAVLFVISDGNATLLYGNDTGALRPEVWEMLRERRFLLDLVILDHTYGLHPYSPNHMNGAQVSETLGRLRELGLLAPGARCLANHISHHGNPPHPALVEFAHSGGYDVAFDGLTITLPASSES